MSIYNHTTLSSPNPLDREEAKLLVAPSTISDAPVHLNDPVMVS